MMLQGRVNAFFRSLVMFSAVSQKAGKDARSSLRFRELATLAPGRISSLLKELVKAQKELVKEQKKLSKGQETLGTEVKALRTDVNRMNDSLERLQGVSAERHVRNVIREQWGEPVARPFTVNGIQGVVRLVIDKKTFYSVSEVENRDKLSDVHVQWKTGRRLALTTLREVEPALRCLLWRDADKEPLPPMKLPAFESDLDFSGIGEEWAEAIEQKKIALYSTSNKNELPKLKWLVTELHKLAKAKSVEPLMDMLTGDDGLGLCLLMFVAEDLKTRQSDAQWETGIVRTIQMDLRPQRFQDADGTTRFTLGEIKSNVQDDAAARKQMQKHELALKTAARLLGMGRTVFTSLVHYPYEAVKDTKNFDQKRMRAW